MFWLFSPALAFSPLTSLEIQSMINTSDALPPATLSQVFALTEVSHLFFPQALPFNLGARLSRAPAGGAALNPEIYTVESLATFRKKYLENDHMIYVENFFSDASFLKIKKETERLWGVGAAEIEPNCNLDGRDRIGGFVQVPETANPETSLYSTIYANEELFDWVGKIAGSRNFFPADFPIELREYGPKSRGMACHSDLQMYEDPEGDLEIVITLSHEKGSKSRVKWFDRAGKEKSVRPIPNSITIVKPNAAVHCVSGTRGGSREILKFILVSGYGKPAGFHRYAENACDLTQGENRRAIDRRVLKQEL